MDKVLITGAGGFIGSHLTEALLAAGHDVRAMVHYNSSGSQGWLDHLPKTVQEAIEVVPSDVRDAAAVRAAMKGRDTVYHLAALIGIPYSYTAAESYVDTNIKGTLNILQSAKELNVGRVLLTSTSEVYGTARYVPMDEGHPLQGQSPYSATKIAADKLGEAFYRSFDLPVVTVRPFNTYGPRQSTRAVIPTIITQLLAGRTEIRLGNLRATRDMNYVKDTAAGFMRLAASDQALGTVVNLSTGVEVSVAQLAETLIGLINPQARIVVDTDRLRPEASEVDRLLGDNGRMRSLTGWEPAYTLASGLAETVDWFRRNCESYRDDRYRV